MSFNTAGCAQVPLTVFGGLVSEMSPADLPEGVSPACNDVVFAPGSVASRPALQKVFSSPFSHNVTITYGKTYLTPAGGIENLYLDSLGNLWFEDVVNSPGTAAIIGTLGGETCPYAKSITAFGREYVASSNGPAGQDVAVQITGNPTTTGWIDRVTQDGPAVAPSVSSVAFPSVVLISTTTILPTISECDPTGMLPNGVFTALNIFVTTASMGSISPGMAITLSGFAAGFNQTCPITSVILGTSTSILVASLPVFLPAGTTYSTGGTGAVPSGYLNRANNTVTATATSAHNLQIGYQVLIAGAPATQVGSGISSIVINNENLAGIATVTLSGFSAGSPSGLQPGNQVAITGVNAVTVGNFISSVFWAGGVVTVLTSTAHGLSPGATVTITGITGATGYNTTATVLSVMSTTTFTYALPLATAPSGTPSNGIVTLNWPIPDSADPTLFEIIAVPTYNTFQVQVNYSDGAWASGNVYYAWNGTYYVTAIPSATIFQYQQYGPPSPSGGGISTTTATPYGQCAPGVHQVRMSFLTRNGYITKPSPAAQFTAPGGQYVSVSNMILGPPNVVARILQFTGAGGSYFFYLPTIPQVDGLIVGSSTQINDNTTTSCVLDFGDPTLFAGIGTSQGGNNLANQQLLDSAVGFGFFANRLIAYGMRNRIQNFLNMGFEGGYVSGGSGGGLSNIPAGWKGTGGNGSLTAGHYGVVWVAGSASLSQGAYQDSYGAPILSPNTLYRARFWANGNSKTVTITLSSSSTGLSITATQPIISSIFWYETAFSGKTGATIGSDTILTVAATSGCQVDDISIIYDSNPYLTTTLWGSYVDNPEAFDGVSGVFGPTNDTHQVLECVELSRGQQSILVVATQDPGGRLHRIINNGSEPAYWPVYQVGSNCGVLGPFATTKSQSDDSTSSGGEQWIAWASATGARIYDGTTPWKISQEIEPDWEAIVMGYPAGQTTVGGSAPVQTSVWALNDPVARTIYFGLPSTLFSNPAYTAPNVVYMLNYRELDTASQIAQSPPIHTSYTGRLIATDHNRKWAPWFLTLNGAALMYRGQSTIQPVFFCGNGQQPQIANGFGNVYTLNSAKYTDDDYGQIIPSYTTFFFCSSDQEERFQLGSGQKTVKYLTAFIAGLGSVRVIPLVASLSNTRTYRQRVLIAAPINDQEMAVNVQGPRIAFHIGSLPSTGIVNTSVSGTTYTVTFLSGDAFYALYPTEQIIIHAQTYTIAAIQSPTQLTLTTSAGTQTNVVWELTSAPDNWFNLQKLMVAIQKTLHLPVRGGA